MPGSGGEPTRRPPLGELARVFLRISLLGFGGPSAHLALMLDEVVERRAWITREHFLHLVGITNLLPGPNSSEVAIHIGYTQRGWRGALVTGTAFLAPTFLLVVLLSALYFRYGSLPAVEPLFWGLRPVIVAIVLAAGWRLAGTSVTALPLLLLAALGAAVAIWLGGWEVAAMAAGGGAGWLLYRDHEARPDSPGRGARGRVLPALVPVGLVLVAGGAGPLAQLFAVTLGIGTILFGGGYVLVTLLRPYAVERYAWLSATEFLDGVALSQAVPGPISSLAAFVGYAAGGVAGAALGTLGIYLPAFAAVLAVAPHLEHWRHLPDVRAALRGVNAVVAGAILGIALALAPEALPDPAAGAVLALALGAALGLRVGAPWLVLGGLVLGALRAAL